MANTQRQERDFNLIDANQAHADQQTRPTFGDRSKSVIKFVWLTATLPIWVTRIAIYDLPKNVINAIGNQLEYRLKLFKLEKLPRILLNTALSVELITATVAIVEKITFNIANTKDSFVPLHFLPNAGYITTKVNETLHLAFSEYQMFALGFQHSTKLKEALFGIVRLPFPVYGFINPRQPALEGTELVNLAIFAKSWVDVYLPIQISTGIDRAILEFNKQKASDVILTIAFLALASIPLKLIVDANSRRRARNNALRYQNNQNRRNDTQSRGNDVLPAQHADDNRDHQRRQEPVPTIVENGTPLTDVASIAHTLETQTGANKEVILAFITALMQTQRDSLNVILQAKSLELSSDALKTQQELINAFMANGKFEPNEVAAFLEVLKGQAMILNSNSTQITPTQN